MNSEVKVKKPIYKRWWFIVIAVVLVLGIIGSFMDDGEDADKPKEPAKIAQAEELGMTEELYGHIKEAYAAVGIDNIEKLEKVEGKEAYQLIYEDYYVTANLGEDGSLLSIMSGQIFFWADGEVVKQVQDVFVTTEQYAKLAYKSEDLVKAQLKSPSTAKFPGKIMDKSEWKITKSGNTYFVNSWVDSQNSFGAIIRSEFIVQYDWDGSDDTEPTVVDLAIG